MNLCIVCGCCFTPNKYHPKQLCCDNRACKQKRNNHINLAYKKEWANKNKDKYLLYKQTDAYKVSRKKSSRKYYLSNKAYYTEYASIRNRCVKQAIPSWSNKEDIVNVYLEAQYYQLEVDHIIPLQHPLVCGLHVWDNLQLLSRSDNAKKSNKFDSDVLAKIE